LSTQLPVVPVVLLPVVPELVLVPVSVLVLSVVPELSLPVVLPVGPLSVWLWQVRLDG
jgi:hypothetical protein